MISNFFYTVFYEPLLNSLIWIIGIIPYHDVGFAIIILTLFVRAIVFPFNHRAIVTQRKIKQLEPKLKEIKEKFKKDNQEQAKKIMELYKGHGINPFSGFLTLLIQLPLIFALYKVFSSGINFDHARLYSFISVPDKININFLGIFDITQKSYIWAFLTAGSQFLQMRLAIPPVKNFQKAVGTFKEDFAKNMSMQMRYVLPFFIFFVALRFSAAISVYWTTMNIFAIVHETIVKNKAEKYLENGTAKTNNKRITGGDA